MKPVEFDDLRARVERRDAMNDVRTNVPCVLVVDDNPDDRALVKRQLQQEFRAVFVEVATLDEFYAALNEGRFDVAVTDYNLRWADGLFVTRALKARHPDCPVVMFTNSGNEEIAVRALKQGVDDYVLKRKGYRSLAKTVRRALSWGETRAGRTPRCLVYASDRAETDLWASLVRGSTNVYIVTSHSAADALPTLESASRHTYDAALVRSIAADDECFRVLEALAELHPHVPSLCLIDGDGDEEHRAYVAGAWSVMHVPAEHDVVLRWLDRAFAMSRMTRRVVRQNEALDQYAQQLEQTKPADGSSSSAANRSE